MQVRCHAVIRKTCTPKLVEQARNSLMLMRYYFFMILLQYTCIIILKSEETELSSDYFYTLLSSLKL